MSTLNNNIPDTSSNNVEGEYDKKSRGSAIQVVMAKVENERHIFDLNTEAIEQVLLSDKVRDKHVAVVSVAGAFRRGKSFLLDFFLRYLEAEQGQTGMHDWLGDPDSPLTGFPWRGGSERDTIGILLWDQPFICKLPSGKEIAVLLMDTQGAFDSHSTVKECATVFALSTMLSSIQVYNISNNIQEDHLQHLQLFTEYGRLAQLQDDQPGGGGPPFQNLEFLVRDWSFPYEYDFGEEGGTKILHSRLQVSESQHSEHQQIRRHIWSCFKRIGCFLMPHPGLKVATNPKFDGRLSDIDPDFLTQLKKLVTLLLSPENLVVKEINGSKVTGRALLEYFKAYVKMYQGDELPEPKTMLHATAEANNLAALASSKDCYTKAMDKICGGDQPYLAPELLELESDKFIKDALAKFNKTRKMGGEEFSANYLTQLETELVSLSEAYKSNNLSKNLLSGARTPMVIVVCMMIVYFLSGLLDVIGLDPVANMLGWVLWVFLAVLGLWVYVNYSGEMRECGATIDSVSEVVLEKVLRPAYIALARKTTQVAINRTIAGNSTTTSSARSKRD